MSCACSRTVSGEVLDLVVDFVTYVFVPAYAITASGLLMPLAAPLLGVGIVVSSALYFADRRMKTDDNHFRGFPALWNAAAFYLFLLHPPPWLASLAVAVLIVLTFVPFNVLHPVRVVRLRGLTLSLIGIWRGARDLRAGQGFRCQRARNHRTLCDRPLCRGERRGDPDREVFQGMIELLTSPEAWAALLTLTALEIVLGIDNVIFLSVIVSRLPELQAKRARQIGLALALVFRIMLLSVLVWLIGLTQPVLTVRGIGFSWRDIILIGGGLFLIAKATHEIHREMEAREPDHEDAPAPNAFFWVIIQIIIIDHGVLAGFDHHRDRHGAGSRDHDRGGHHRRHRHVHIGRSGHEVRGGASDHQDAGAGVSGADRPGAGGRRIPIPHSARLHLLCDHVFGRRRILQCSRQAQPKKGRQEEAVSQPGE